MPGHLDRVAGVEASAHLRQANLEAPWFRSLMHAHVRVIERRRLGRSVVRSGPMWLTWTVLDPGRGRVDTAPHIGFGNSETTN
jgi:hypothetical protein